MLSRREGRVEKLRELRELPRGAAVAKLTSEHDLDQQAAENVLRYLADQELATQQVPDDRTIVIERVRDELGDWRVCCLTPFGSRVHAPWAMAATAKVKGAGLDVETMWSEDGFVLPIIAINKHTGKPEGLPEIVSRGFMSSEDSSALMQEARQVVLKTLDSSTAEERGDWGVMQEKIRADLKRFLTKQTSRRPLIMPVILEV